MRRSISLIILVIFSFTILANPIFAANGRGTSDVVIDETIIEPKDPILCTVIAVGPGLLAHGFGNFYAEDYRMGLTLFGIELISLILIGTGFVIYKSPKDFLAFGGDGNDDLVERGGLITISCGVALFGFSWMGDVVTAGRAAEQFNYEHRLEFKLQQESYTPTLNYSFKF